MTSKLARREVQQRTLARSASISGIGLHSGLPVKMALCPAPVGHGVVFLRKDSDTTVPATWRHAVESPLCPTLVDGGGGKIATIEHLLSALAALGVDNLLVELDGPEAPVLDGSSARFVELIDEVGLVTQGAPRRAIEILTKVEVSEPGRSASLEPAARLEMSFAIDFADPAIGKQYWEGPVDEALYRDEIAQARTFGLLAEVEAMQRMGLGRGGSLDNAVVVDNGKVMNPEGLRYSDEFVRHKVLDAIGDLALAGAPILGRFVGDKAGHALTLRLLNKLFETPKAWRWVTVTEPVKGGASAQVNVRVAAQRA
ncbi:MAG: UDP-3-O-acyl-N-acetylglucosamine deacetylase [Rhodospirillales bacterium]